MTVDDPSKAKPGPLTGVRVLDLSRVLAAPSCTQILGDLGADIIKVERPGTGDEIRGWGPPFLKDADGKDTGESGYYLSTGRNKRSVTIDMSRPEGLPAGGNAALLVSTSKDPARLEASWKFLKYITSGLGAAAVAETTGYMPPNKAANEIILKDFYARNPNKQTAVRQLPLLREWIAYPGDKGLAVTQVFYDAMEGILLGDLTDMKDLQAGLVEEVNEMLPK